MSSGCVSKTLLRSSGSSIQGCLLRVQKCVAGRSQEVSSKVPARTMRNPLGSAIQVLRRCISMSRILDIPTASGCVRCRRCGAVPVAQHPSDGRLARLPHWQPPVCGSLIELSLSPILRSSLTLKFSGSNYGVRHPDRSPCRPVTWITPLAVIPACRDHWLSGHSPRRWKCESRTYRSCSSSERRRRRRSRPDAGSAPARGHRWSQAACGQHPQTAVVARKKVTGILLGMRAHRWREFVICKD
jgi:hypothetical protein